MTDSVVYLVSLIVLLGLDFLAMAARTGFLQTSHARLLALRDEKSETAVNRAIRWVQSRGMVRATLQLLLLLTRFGLAGLILIFTINQQPDWPLVANLGVLFAGALLLFTFEWGIERWVVRDPETWAVRMGALVLALTRTLGLILVPFASARETSGISEGPGSVTEDELKVLMDAGQEEGLFEKGESQMIFSIFQLGETLAREIMVPRIDVLALDVNTPLADAADALIESGHSRVPVFEETIDRTLGLLYTKDLLRVWREGSTVESLRDLLRPAYFVPEAKKVDELLTEMQSQRIHLAIVVDEYGGAAGLVTLEDIVEEILGEILDEYDQGEESPYQLLKNGDYLFLGRIDLDDFNEIMSSSLPADEADTLGGYIYSRIGRVPDAGEIIRHDDLVLTVEQVTGRRIRKVRAHWAPLEQENGNDRHDGKQTYA